MSINSKTKATVDTLLTNDATTEAQFKTGLQDVTTEVDSLNTGTVKTNTSFGGDVSGTYDAIVVANDSHTHDTRYYTETEIDDKFAGGVNAPTGYDKTNWDTAYTWGDHSTEGYLTDVNVSDIVAADLLISTETFVDSDTKLMSAAAIDDRIVSRLPSDAPPSDTEREQWNEAYSWGDHSTEGYLTTIAFSEVTGKPTTISGYGITDAFDGAFSSLSGKPTTLSGYGITDAFDGAFSSLSGKPTTVEGYGITGGTLSGDLNVDGGDLIVTRTNEATTGGRLDLYLDTSSPADGDLLGVIRGIGPNSVGSNYTYAAMEFVTTDVTSGSEDGAIKFYGYKNSNYLQTATLKPGEIQFADTDGTSGLGLTDSGVTVRNLLTTGSFKFSDASSSTVDIIRDEDTMSSNDANALATQQSIKAYVDNNSTTISNSSGSAPLYAARAWGSFDGTDYTGSAIDLTNFSTGNVSSIDRTGTGQYTINFSTAMPNTTYTFIGTINGNTPVGGGRELLFFALSQTTTSVTVQCQREETETFVDAGVLSFVIFAG